MLDARFFFHCFMMVFRMWKVIPCVSRDNYFFSRLVINRQHNVLMNPCSAILFQYKVRRIKYLWWNVAGEPRNSLLYQNKQIYWKQTYKYISSSLSTGCLVDLENLEFEMDLEMTWNLGKNTENLEFCGSRFHTH